MRAVIQRVDHAKVYVDDQCVGQIDQGLLVYLGIAAQDHENMIEKMGDKLLNLRVFEDEQGKMNLSVLDVGGSVMVISQFTLYGDAKKGNRPSFTQAMPLDQALPFYEGLIAYLAKKINVKYGVFGAHMKIDAINNGPVTIIYEI